MGWWVLLLVDMPLDAKRKHHHIRSSDELDLSDDCFMMRATGELFKDYEEYLNALLDYQARRWSCAVSGKGKLTYEEAQLSEKNAQRRVDAAFPDIFLEPLCRMVHMSQRSAPCALHTRTFTYRPSPYLAITRALPYPCLAHQCLTLPLTRPILTVPSRRMDELIDAIFKRLSCFRNGEDIEWVQGDGREPLCVKVLRPVDVDEDIFLDMDPEAMLPTRYVVTTGVKKSSSSSKSGGDDKSELSGGEGGEGGECGEGDEVGEDGDREEELEEIEVGCEDLRRPKGRSVSRMTIKSKLKTVGSRESYWQAPFLCEPELVKELGLQSELPPHIKRLKLANDVKLGKVKKEELAILDPGLAEERARKRRRKSGETNDPQKLAKSVLKSPVQKKVSRPPPKLPSCARAKLCERGASFRCGQRKLVCVTGTQYDSHHRAQLSTSFHPHSCL